MADAKSAYDALMNKYGGEAKTERSTGNNQAAAGNVAAAPQQSATTAYQNLMEKYGGEAKTQSAPVDNWQRFTASQLEQQQADAAAKHAASADPTFFERIKNIFTGAAKSYGGQMAGTAGALAQTVNEGSSVKQQSGTNLKDDGVLKSVLSIFANGGGGDTTAPMAQTAQISGGSLDNTVKNVKDTARQLNASAARDIDRASDGLGIVGRTLVNAGVAGVQMGADVAAGALTGGGSMLPMVVRSFGGGVQDAEAKGYSYGQAMSIGLANAATEYFTEKLFGGNPAYDADVGFVNKLVAKVTKNEKLIAALSSLPADILSEGLEEVIADVLEPAAEWAITGNRPEYELDQIIEDGVVGMILGGMGQAGNAVVNAARGTNAQATQQQAAAQITAPADAGARQTTAEGNLTPAQTDGMTARKTGNNAALNENGLAALTEQERVNLSSGSKNKIVSTFNEAVDFIRNALTNRQSTDRAYMGKVTDATAAKVLAETGIDISGYNAILPSDTVRHMFKNHGDPLVEAARGQVALSPETAANLTEVLSNPDKVSTSGQPDAFGRPTLMFEKQIGDNYITAQAITDGTKSLTTDTMYVMKKKASPATAGEAVTPLDQTSETSNRSTLSNSNVTIPQASNVVKGADVSDLDTGTVGAGNYGQAPGVAQQGFSVSHGEQVPTQNRTITNSSFLTEEERAQFPPQTHERISEAQSVERAQQQFYADENGRITNIDDTIQTLAEKEAFRGEDQDAVHLALRHVAEASRAERQNGGEVSEATRRQMQELSDLDHRIGATVAGQSLQARQKWINTASDILSRSHRILENARENTNRQDVLDTITDFALEFDDAMDARDWTGIGDIIRRTSRFRRTGSFFTNSWSRTMENALNRVVKQAAEGDASAQTFLENHAANGLVAIAQDYTPVRAADAFLTIRRNAMLSKVSTTMRNLVSNNVFDPIDSVSRDIAVPLDMLLSRATGTRSTAIDRSWISEAKRRGAMEGLERSILEVGLDVDASGERGRYENGAQRTFSMQGGTFSRLLSTWEKHLGYRLYSTDQFQKGGIDAEVQRGIDELYERGLITRRNADGQRVVDDSLREVGATEALYRTFQDSTALSRAVLGVRRGMNEVQVGGVGLGDIAIPFAQVPTNLATRALEYSPLNIARGTVQLAQVLRAAHNGTLTAAQQAQAVQSIGRGLNGTALIAGAAALALKGVLHVSDVGDDEDKDKKALEKAAGVTGTQLNLSAVERWAQGESTEWRDGDVLHAIGYLDPLNAMLTTGALIARDIQDDEASVTSVLKDSLDGTIQSVLEIPVMQTLKDTADAFNYSSESTTGGKARNAAAEFAAGQVSSIIPNSLKGIAQGTDRYQRDQYTSDTLAGQTWDAIKAAIPMLRETLPEKLDSYGQPIENVDPWLNFLNANISPGSYVRYQRPQQEVTAEIDRLNDATGDNGVYPSRSAPNSVTSGGKKYELTAEEKRAFQQTAGAEFLKFANAIINGRRYGLLSDQDKADALSSAVVYANAKARQGLIESKGGEYSITGEARTIEKSLEARGAGIDPSEYFMLKVVHDEINAGDGTAAEKATRFAQYLNRQSWLNDKKREKAQELLSFSSGFRAEVNEKALAAADAGTLTLDQYYDVKARLSAYLGNNNLSKQRLVDFLDAYFPYEQRRELFDIYQGGGQSKPWKNPY